MQPKLLLFLTFIALISCKKEAEIVEKKEKTKKEIIITKKEIIITNIGNKLKERLKNPDSYKFVSIDSANSYSVKERRQKITKATLEEMRELNKTIPSPELLSRMETEFFFLEKQTDENKIAIYRYNFIAKGTNSYGGTIQTKYSADVLNDENYTALSVSKND